MGSLDLPSEPESAGRVGRFRGDGEAPRDPGERERVHEEARAYVERCETGQPADRDYWDAVPRFVRAWEDHRERWPADRQPVADPDPRGSVRGDGERGAEVTDAIADVRKAEAGLSADAQRIERENASGGWLEGFEFRLKGEDRLMEKATEQVKAKPRETPGEVLRRIPDAIRYTFCLQPDRYVSGYYDVKARLEGCGHEMYYSENWWSDPEYKGVNTRWVTQEGQRFEVQFHTRESFHAKQHVTHGVYERIRSPLTSRPELRELHAFQREVSSAISIPDGATEIPNYRKEGF